MPTIRIGSSETCDIKFYGRNITSSVNKIYANSNAGTDGPGNMELFMEKPDHGLCGKGQQCSQYERRKQRKKKADSQPNQEKREQYGKNSEITGTQEGHLLPVKKI